MRTLILSLFMTFSLIATAATPTQILYVTDQDISRIKVSARSTVISLPAPPTQVVVGGKSFRIQKIESDIIVTPYISGATNHMYAYVLGRRFNFELTSHPQAPALYVIRDKAELEFKKKEVSRGKSK